MKDTPQRRSTDQTPPLTGWAAFGKYVGVQGILAFVLIGGYVIASVGRIQLPDTYNNLTFAVLAYYFAKNGVGIMDIITRSKNA